MARILVVDDSTYVRRRTSRMLRDAGYDVIEAPNGRVAVDVYGRERPNAVLMDITMPEMDGLEALDQIRALDPHARVAMLTAVGQQAVIMNAVRRGAREYLVKPFALAPFLDTVSRLLQ